MKKIIEKIFEMNRFVKILIQLLVDGILISFSIFCAWYLRLDQTSFLFLNEIKTYSSLLIPITLILFYKFGFYQNIVRFISLSFLKSASIGSLASALLFFIISYSLNLFLPKSIPLIYLLILLITICGVRFQLSFIYQFYINKRQKRIGIIDTNQNGIKLAGLLSSDDESNLIAFFDEKPSIIGSKISGVLVYKLDQLEKIVIEKKINILLITNKNIPKKINQSLLNCIQRQKIKVKKAPNLNDLKNFYDSVELKSISIEDIIGRKTIEPNTKLLDKDIKNKVVIVTGAGGSIGSELCIQILNRKPKTLILFELSEFNLYTINKNLLDRKEILGFETKIIPVLGSIQNENQLNDIFKLFKINTVYHSAAYKHVPLLEMNVIQGIKNNICGTKILIDVTKKYETKKFILISSDKAIRPTNIMGATKRVAEILCLLSNEAKSNTIFSIVRFGNVLQSSGSVVPLFNNQIKNGGPLTVTDPRVERYFMTIKEAAELVIQAGSMAKKSGDIFILDMGKRLKIIDLAEQMIKLNGKIPLIDNQNKINTNENEIKIVFTGLRPGEKLIEELIYKTKIFKTTHPRIIKTKDNLCSSDKIQKHIQDLICHCKNENFKKAISSLKAIDKNFNISNYHSDILIQEFND